ncbi:MAG: aminopeptidase, partial [Pseudonocardiales bacterium]|nr:aminopeptidase [Pseudonocardiales bacterium]
NAELGDLLAAWTAAGADDIENWAAQWLRVAGLDTLRTVGNSILRETPAALPAARGHEITVASYDDTGAPLQHIAVVVAADETEIDIAPAALVLADARDETWAKIALPEASWVSLPTFFPALDLHARVVIWTALQSAIADADIDPAVALEFVRAGIPAEGEDSVLGQVLSWATDTLAGTYLDDARRPAALAIIAAAAQASLGAAAPATGHQLAALRGVVAAGTDIRRLRGWLDGDVPDGVDLDVDLRWRIISRLCAFGDYTADELATAAGQDDSAEGAQHAALCEALIPDADAKRAAWQRLMVDRQCPNSLLYATARGFWHPSQSALTDPYVQRYFDEIGGTAALRSGFVVARLAGLAYPWTAVSRRTLTRTTEFLAATDVPAGIRRAVLDNGDDLRRALESRERFP